MAQLPGIPDNPKGGPMDLISGENRSVLLPDDRETPRGLGRQLHRRRRALRAAQLLGPACRGVVLSTVRSD